MINDKTREPGPGAGGAVWKLADALMDMVNQHCFQDAQRVDHCGLSSNELALEVLEEMGLAKALGGRLYTLDWDALKALEARPAPAAPAVPLDLLRQVFYHRLPIGERVDDVICRDANDLYWKVSALLGGPEGALAARESAPSSLPLDLEAAIKEILVQVRIASDGIHNSQRWGESEYGEPSYLDRIYSAEAKALEVARRLRGQAAA